jgi:hypothetical protein
MIAFAGIDGTGPWSNATYEKDFASSHVHKLYQKWPWPSLAFYSRGPSLLGMETGTLALMAYYFVKDCIENKGAKGIFLAGYSRGGAAAIEAASYLDGFIWSTQVNCLILFDAVDRSTTVGGTIFDTAIGNNVELCLHAMRDPKSESRESFDNCGQRVTDRGKTVLITRKFVGTHGAIGGTPWTGGKANDYIDEGGVDGATKITYAQDKAMSEVVWNWMNPRVNAALKLAKGKRN